ncbi:MAG: hypothetical protein H6531_03560 [Actinobacteria bacterium]|nr:hypothetical protein [Thermoleophilia bacterium]MCB9010894.1 hypothetical protein [Actinomycetota bacterium]
MLAVLYCVFAVAAGARSGYQIATQFSDAPLAYGLSALAAIIYLVAAWCFLRPSDASLRTATVLLWVELAGVVSVGLFTLVAPDRFPDATVWSDFGIGYGFVPLVLPIAGLWWLTRPQTREAFGAD